MCLLLAAILTLTHQQTARIDNLVTSVMQRERIAGMSVGVARDGTRLYLRGFGLRDVAGRRAADGYTIYPIGSLTKQFTAALVLQQNDAQAIALHAPVSQYLPFVGGAAGNVTVAQLLGQISGIPSYTDRSQASMAALVASNLSPDALWSSVARLPLAFEPGAQWEYSNTNYLLLGMILQRVTSTPYATLVRERITSPLGLRSTAFGLPSDARNVASGYAWRNGFETVPESPALFETAFSAGGLASNVPDVLAWLDDLRGGRVVSPAAFATMTKSVRLNDGVPAQYGFGFFVNDWYGYRVTDHDGNIDGFSSEDALVLDDGLEIALLANADRVDLTPLSKSIMTVVDRPRDANLYATASRPPENENPAIAAEVRAVIATPAFAGLGAPRTIEFVERTVENGITYDRYRVTFASGPWWVTVGYLKDGTIRSLTFEPDAG